MHSVLSKNRKRGTVERFLLFRIVKFLVAPKSGNKDRARRERILNILLLGWFTLGLIATSVNKFFELLEGEAYSGVPSALIFAVALMFLALYFFSRAGAPRLVASIFLLVSVLPAYFTSYKWGFINPQALLLYCLTIVMAGILLSSKAAFLLTAVHALFLISLSYFQGARLINYDISWRNDLPGLADGITASATLGVIVIVSWLFNREIEKALKRAQRSEKALKKERDFLEVKVEERTKELNKVQLEKAQQLYRLADFGRIAAGLFHDLVNPLTTVSLYLDQLQEKGIGVGRKKLSYNTEKLIRRAVKGTDQMKMFVKMVRKQIQEQKTESYYFLNDETAHVIEMIEYRAKELDVGLDFVSTNRIRTYGNSYRYNQLVSNLACNAIESYERLRKRKNRKVVINLSKENGKVTLIVQDFGCGIPKKNLKKIFDPFFTTKSAEKGIGIGLSICKDIAQKELKGKIKVNSKEGEGTTFKVEFPVNKKLIK